MQAKKIEEKIQRMNALTKQIIEMSVQSAQPVTENRKNRASLIRQQKQTKNASISELMSLIAECRKMNLNEADKATLEAAITKLNKKLYDATSLTIV